MGEGQFLKEDSAQGTALLTGKVRLWESLRPREQHVQSCGQRRK